MWRIWLMFDPRRMMIALTVFLAVLAFFLHFLVLSTDRFNWVEGTTKAASVIEVPAMDDVTFRVTESSLQIVS
ncbi:MAG: light-harvesting antenna LH1, alpha subunit [Pseudomonadota bacterium]